MQPQPFGNFTGNATDPGDDQGSPGSGWTFSPEINMANVIATMGVALTVIALIKARGNPPTIAGGDDQSKNTTVDAGFSGHVKEAIANAPRSSYSSEFTWVTHYRWRGYAALTMLETGGLGADANAGWAGHISSRIPLRIYLERSHTNPPHILRFGMTLGTGTTRTPIFNDVKANIKLTAEGNHDKGAYLRLVFDWSEKGPLTLFQRTATLLIYATGEVEMDDNFQAALGDQADRVIADLSTDLDPADCVPLSFKKDDQEDPDGVDHPGTYVRRPGDDDSDSDSSSDDVIIGSSSASGGGASASGGSASGSGNDEDMDHIV